MQTPYCFYLVSVCLNLVIFCITAEADLQRLSHALRILSESEKQLRISKNQTTWFTAALLQLSSVEYSSADTNTTKLCTRAASIRGGLDFLFSTCYVFLFPSSLESLWGGAGRVGVVFDLVQPF